jgi:hypothetical protein
MNYQRNFIFGALTLIIGCSSTSKSIYQQGYQEGVHEQIKQVASEFSGGRFPYYHWSSPIVQEVQVPAHLANGVMIPNHSELVIIKPGEWSLSPAYPIKTQQRNSDDNKTTYLDVANLTALPQNMGHAQSN